MPPKPKHTREEIAEAALGIIKEGGLSALTARTLGNRLNASAGSIFTVLKSMDEVRMAARAKAMEEFRAFISDYREYKPPFKRIGLMIVNYGMREPELFKLLFMTQHESARGFEETISDLGEIYPICLELIRADYGLSRADAQYMFEHMWTHAFGLGAMCATRVCALSEEEIMTRLGNCFISMYMLMRSGKMREANARAVEISESEFAEYRSTTLDETLFAGASEAKHTEEENET